MKNFKLKILVFCWGIPVLLLLIFLSLLFFAGKSYMLTGSAAGLLAGAVIQQLAARKKFLYDFTDTGDTIVAVYADQFIRTRNILFVNDGFDIVSVHETNKWYGWKDTMLVSDSNKSINFVIIDKKLHERLLQKTGLPV